MTKQKNTDTQPELDGPEITEAMLAAGWDALCSFSSEDYPSMVMVFDVLHAALAVAPKGKTVKHPRRLT